MLAVNLGNKFLTYLSVTLYVFLFLKFPDKPEIFYIYFSNAHTFIFFIFLSAFVTKYLVIYMYLFIFLV